MPVYQESGCRIIDKESPWGSYPDEVYAGFFSGPYTAITNTFFCKLGFNSSVLLLRSLTLLAIPLSFYLVQKILYGNQITPSTLLIYPLILFSFPVRAALEYGQPTVIYLLFLVLGIYRLRFEQSLKSNWLYLFLICLAIDYKPHVFGVIFILLNSIRIIKRFAPLIASLNLFGYLLIFSLTGATPLQHFKSIVYRGRNMANVGDQMSIHALSNSFGKWLILITLSFILWTLFISRTSQILLNACIHRNVFVYLLIQVISPFLHPQDLIFFALYFFSLLLHSPLIHFQKVFVFLLPLVLTWSNNPLISLTVAIISLFIGWLLNLRLNAGYLFLILASFHSFILLFPSREGDIRHLYNLSSIFILLYVLTKDRSTK